MAEVNLLTKKTISQPNPNSPSADELNKYFAAASYDSAYVEPSLKHTAHTNQDCTTEESIFHILDHLHHTSQGCDGLPAWFLRLTAPGYARILATLINQSLALSHVPKQWKEAIIHPKAKTTNPTSPSDFRPLSVLPVLSRLVERIVVRTYLYPSFEDMPQPMSLHDQYAFRPTGSTTAALISIIHHASDLLKSNEHVVIISMDYSKAFDSIKHSAITNLLATLDLPDFIYN